MTRHRSSLAAALVPALVVLAACGGGGDTTAVDTLTVGLAGEVDCVDPHQAAQTQPLHVARQVVDNLTDQDPETGEITPWVATDWTVSDDARTFTFTLRDDVTFSDGTPLDADAVVANLEDVVDLGARSPLGAGYLADLDEVTALDPTTVRVTFERPSAQFLQATSMVTLGLLAPSTLEATPAERCAGELVGSGPFVVDSVTAQREAVLERRDDYAWASERLDHDGPAALRTVRFTVTPDASVRHGSLTSGQIGVDTQVLPQDEAAFGDGLTLASAPRPGIVYTLLPNESRGPLRDDAVRRAVGLAIDREGLAPLLSSGERPATDALASTTPGYRDRSADLARDVDKAARLLDGAGWTRSGDGVRSRDGEQLSLTLVYSSAEPYGTVYELLSQQLAEVGIDLRLAPLDDASNVARQGEGDYDFVSWAVTRADPSILASIYPVESANPLRRTDPDRLDDLVAEISASVAAESRSRSVDAAVEEIMAGGHGLPLFEQAASIGLGEGVEGVTLDAASRPVLLTATVRR